MAVEAFSRATLTCYQPCLASSYRRLTAHPEAFLGIVPPLVLRVACCIMLKYTHAQQQYSSSPKSISLFGFVRTLYCQTGFLTVVRTGRFSSIDHARPRVAEMIADFEAASRGEVR